MLSSVAERLEGIELAREALADLDNLFNYLAALGAPEQHYEFDLALARGLEYYTGPVFETTVEEPKIGSLGGAGRYDGLVGMFSGQELPATGMSLGLERIIDVAEELGLLNFGTTVSASVGHDLRRRLGDDISGAGFKSARGRNSDRDVPGRRT